MVNIYESLEESYYETLKDLKSYGYTSSPRDRKTHELIGYNFIIENPRNRVISNKHRNLNPFFLIGNFLWVMSKSNSLDFIKYYNPNGIKFSHDGETLPAAYGKRIFDIDGVNQYENCIRELKLDPDSRRAIISIHLPQYDWRGYLDTACTSDFQFFIRDNRLHMINHMRSQSAAMVMPYDIFLMTMIQEFMANELDVELGGYQHFCGSIHYFENEEGLVDTILDNKSTPTVMDKMTKISREDFSKLLEFEKNLREEVVAYKLFRIKFHEAKWLSKMEDLKLDDYWKQICYMLIIKALDYNGSYYDDLVHEKISEPFKSLLLNR